MYISTYIEYYGAGVTPVSVNFRKTALGHVKFHDSSLHSDFFITFPSVLRLFALVTIYLQVPLLVSLYLLFHQNWRSVPIKDPLLCRSVMKTLSNRFGGTQDTPIHDNQANNMSFHNCFFPKCLSLSPHTYPHEKILHCQAWSSRLLAQTIMDPQHLPPLCVPSPIHNPDSLVVHSTQPRANTGEESEAQQPHLDTAPPCSTSNAPLSPSLVLEKQEENDPFDTPE